MASGGCPNVCDNAVRNRVQIRPRSPPRPVAPPRVQVRPPPVRRPPSPPRVPNYGSPQGVRVRPCTPEGARGGYGSPAQDFLNSSEMSSFDTTAGGISSLYSTDGSGYPSYDSSSGMNSSYYNSSGSPGRMRRTTSTTIITTEEEDDDDDEDEDEDDDNYGGGGHGNATWPVGGGGRGNATYTVGGGGRGNATYTCGGGGRGNATYTVGGGARGNATYTVGGGGGRNPAGNATYTVGGGRGNATYTVDGGRGNATYPVAGGRGNATYNVGDGGLGNDTFDPNLHFYRDPPGDVIYPDISMDIDFENYNSPPPPEPYSSFNMESSFFEAGQPRTPLRGPIPGPGCPGGASDGQGPSSHNKTFTKIIKKVVTESPSGTGQGGSGGAGGQSPCSSGGGGGGGGGQASMNQSSFARGIRQCAQSTPTRNRTGSGTPCGNPRCPGSPSQGGAAAPAMPASNASCALAGEVQRQLAQLECTERAQINSDLVMFQQARRRLVEATTTISSSQPPVNFSGLNGNNSTQDST